MDDETPTRTVMPAGFTPVDSLVAQRLVQSRGLPLFVVLAVLAPLLLALVTSRAWPMLNTADPGLLPSARVTVYLHDARWKTPVEDDLVLSVNGVAVTTPVEYWKEVQRVPVGNPLTVRFSRDDKTWDETVSTSARTTLEWITTGAALTCALLLMLMGLLIVLMRPVGEASWIFLGFSFVLAIVVVLDWIDYGYTTTSARVGETLLGFLGALTFHLFSVFPRRVFTSSRGVVICYALATLYAVTFLSIYPDPSLRHVWVQMMTVSRLWVMVMALTGLALLVRQHTQARAHRDPAWLAATRLMLVGVAGGMVTPAAIVVVHTVLGDGSAGWVLPVALTLILILPACVGWLLIKHNPLEIDRFTRQVVGYGLTVSVLGIAVAAVVVAVPAALASSKVVTSAELSVFLTAAFTLAFRPLYGVVRSRLDGWLALPRAELDRVRTLTELGQLVQTGEPREVAIHVIDACLKLGASQVVLWASEGSQDEVPVMRHYGAPSVAALSRQSALGRAMARSPDGGGIKNLCQTPLDDDAQVELAGHQLTLAAPVMARGALAGVLAIGRRGLGNYTLADQAFLNGVAGLFGVALNRGGDEPSTLGKFRLEKRLGVGGMAEVYLASQRGPGGFERKVAVKKPLPQMAEDPACMEMFLDEARISAALNHPNIAQVYEVGSEHGAYFMAMEYVEGPPLRKVLQHCAVSGQRIPVEIVLGLWLPIVDALDHAHSRTDSEGTPLKIVHRDVTPSNILITHGGDMKLLDFGIARAAERLHVTRTGAIKGTLPYMSPEQAAGEPLDGRSDLYTVSILLLELLVLRRAFPKGPDGSPPPRISEYRPDLPEEWDAFFQRALAHKPAHRFSDAKALRTEALKAFSVQPVGRSVIAEWLRHLPL